jgi:hypothetical protein
MTSKHDEDNIHLKIEDSPQEDGILKKEELEKLRREGMMCLFGGFCIHLVKKKLRINFKIKR